jgi:hypothetical protein
MKVSVLKMYRNNSLTMTVLLALVVAGCFLPQQAGAQVPGTDINSYITCVNNFASVGGSVADAARACVPNGCFYTNTLSEESAQPACTLRDGTRLPRVIFSCAVPGGNRRFRPSFSLCTLADVTASIINHIELGEDVAQRIDGQRVLTMGELLLPSPGNQNYSPFGTAGTLPVVDTPAHRVCTDCHDLLATVGGVNLFATITPRLRDGTISSNDPGVQTPANQVPLSTICSDIANSSQLAGNPSKKQLAVALCQALRDKEQ